MKGFLTFLIFLLTFSLYSQDLISSEHLGGRTQEGLNDTYGLPIFTNSVDYYKIQYTTLDVHGVLDTASGLAVFPRTTGKAHPILAYQHGTVGNKEDVPSRLAGGYQLAEVWAGLGYIAVAADYLGLGDSRGFHPFVHTASEASAAIDLIAATKEFADQNGHAYNEQLFVTGYSQGGHGAASLHKVLEENFADELPVTASAPMSGPYSLSGVMLDFLYKEEPFYFVAYFPNTVLSMQTVYGNIFNSLDELFKPVYADLIQPYFEGEKDLFDLNEELIDQLVSEYGEPLTIKMFNETFVSAMENDQDHPLRVALRESDVHNWAPQAPTRLYYCTADDQVTYLNSVVADSVMNAMGAVDLRSIDSNPAADHGECVNPAMFGAIAFFSIYQRIDDVVSTLDPNLESKLMAYPNPVDEILILENELNDARLVVSDINGRVVRTENLNMGKNEIQLGDQSPGMYLLKISSADRFFTEKIILK